MPYILELMLLILILIVFSCLSLSIFVKIFSLFAQNAGNWYFKLEDIVVAGLSSLSLLLIVGKLLNINPYLKLIFTVIVGFIIITVGILLIKIKFFSQDKLISVFYLLRIQQPQKKNSYYFLGIFFFYLFRAFLKAKSFSEVEYIPSRYNTDIFLYLRRISIFLDSNAGFNHQYDGVKGIVVLYDSPKLLSSLIYAIFTNIFNHPGIAGTILTSIILTAIILKYVLLITEIYSRSKIFYFVVITFILFQPALSWLQDQFHLSNLLYIYLLIYTVEDFFVAKAIDRKILLKFTLASIATAGFYPSQLPFLTLATVVLLLLTEEKRANKIKDIVSILTIAIAIFITFISQYIDTTEVTHHFNLTDSIHGINFVYVPFWSLLSLVPKAGGLKVSIDSIFLVVVSIVLTIVTTKYLISKNIFPTKYLSLTAFLYITYSVSFLIFPGSYRQGKFFLTYIIPLALFCFLKILIRAKVERNKLVIAIAIILAIHISWNSLNRKYKSHIPKTIEQTIERLQNQTRPIFIYSNSTEHKYYYLSYQLRNNNLSIINRCPSTTELTSNLQQDKAIVISKNCQTNNFDNNDDNIIYLDL